MLVKSLSFDGEKLKELVEFYANDVDDLDRVKSEIFNFMEPLFR